MPRLLGLAVNELKIHDNISNSDLVLYYRNPTTAERQRYANEAVQRKRNKIVTNIPEARLKWGQQILTGFREGDFMRMSGGKPAAMSSDQASPAYYDKWREELEAHAADLLMLLAAHVFDSSAEAEEPEEDLPGDDADPN